MVWPPDCRKKNDKEVEENVERGNWSGKVEFFLSCLGYAVGLGNIWRFPYLCYRNGGGAFLFPYLFFLAICGFPLFFLEVAYGQFSSLSPIKAWRLSPLFKGVGCGMVVISAVVGIYFNVILAWTLFYLGKSFTTALPWTTCDNAWNTDACVVRNRNNTWLFDSEGRNATNGTLAHLSDIAFDLPAYDNGTDLSIPLPMKTVSPSGEFWERHVLQVTGGIDDIGGMRWELFICLAAAWVATWLCLIKGVKSSGKVVYITAVFPFAVQLIMLFRGVTLPGAIEGIKYFIIPQWDKLLSFKVWGDAAMQIFYSTGAGWGGLITMASYNKFHNNCYRDAVVISSLGSAFSILSGFVAFSIIGFMAHETGADVDNVVAQGPGLIFVVYPAALARLPGGPVWSVLFFLMLFTVGLDSQFGGIETVISTIIDYYPGHLSRAKKMLIGALVCFVLFLFGIPCIMQGGVYVLNLMDWYSASFSIMIIFFTELMVISWIYGINRFMKDIELMIGHQPHHIWKIIWGGITPAATIFVFLFSVIMHAPVTYGGYVYPKWAVGVGWLFALSSLMPIPIFMITILASGKGSFIDRLKYSVKPAPEWGPVLPAYREQYIASLRGPRRAMVRPEISAEDGTALTKLKKDNVA
ncbi:sodium- and chloride-dependent glycine transporter 1-like [Lineus longissimus]|uniref:sodium- and chloride-dependent glycine transporter 1-like n=1 Tax=Lineus longissimus TaxID=88925 RepID=UPI00315D9225